MREYVINVYEEREDTKPVRTYKMIANTCEEAVIMAANESAPYEKRVDADPLPDNTKTKA